MIRYCITVIENSLLSAMLAALIFAAVCRKASLRGKKILALGSLLGCAAALVFAILRRTSAINSGIVNAWILSAVLVSALVFIVLLLRDDGGSRSGLFIASSVLAALLLFYSLPALFLLPSDFVLAGQSVFSTEFLANLAGAALGLLLTLLAAFALFRTGLQSGREPGSSGAGGQGSGRDILCFKLILCTLLLLGMTSQIAEVARFLIARRIIPMWRGFFKLIMAVSNNKPLFMFLEIAVAALLPVVLLVLPALSNPARGIQTSECTLNPAEIRKQKAGLRRRRRNCGFTLALLGFAVFALSALKAWDRREVALSPPEPFTLLHGEIIIPYERIEDGRLHRFAWNASDDTEVRFIVIKKSASGWGVGLDACDICGNTGYYERRDGVICKLCDVVMNKSTIGFKGGCNPVPLAYIVRDGAMIVQTGDLEAEKGRFK